MGFYPGSHRNNFRRIYSCFISAAAFHKREGSAIGQEVNHERIIHGYQKKYRRSSSYQDFPGIIFYLNNDKYRDNIDLYYSFKFKRICPNERGNTSFENIYRKLYLFYIVRNFLFLPVGQSGCNGKRKG
jgi:hypothetical protein